MRSSHVSAESAPEQHVLFLNYYYPPMGGGGVQRVVKLLKYLSHQRIRATVLTVKPSFFYSEDRSLAAEIPVEVDVVRTGSLDPFRLIYLARRWFPGRRRPRAPRKNDLPRESGARMRKIASTIFVPDSRLLWLVFALPRLICTAKRKRIDVVVASMPPFTSGIIAALASYTGRWKTVLDFRDAWTENPYLPEVSLFQRRLNARLEQFCLNRADGLIFVNPKLQSQYLKKYPSKGASHVTSIRNGYDPEDFAFHPAPPGAVGNGLFRMGIMGTIYSQGNRPLTLLKALRRLADQEDNFSSRFRLVLLGKWSPDFLSEIDGSLQPLVEFIPYQPHREALRTASGFDALALTIEGGHSGAAAVTPGRIYEYLALKRPILAICSRESDLAHLIHQSRSGTVVDDDDVISVERVLREWVDAGKRLPERFGFCDIDAYSRPALALDFMHFVERVSGD